MRTSKDLEQRLLAEIMKIPAIDVHSHVPAGKPFAKSLKDLLGYHYFTELAHSAGMDRHLIAPDRPEAEMMPALVAAIQAFDNTVQYSWMIELAQELFGFRHDRLTPENWQELADAVAAKARAPGREREILRASSIEKVFLTNHFDEDLGAIDREIFVPCLRADTLVFELPSEKVRSALSRVTGTEIGGAAGLKAAFERLLSRFREQGAPSVAISLPPRFKMFHVEHADLNRAITKAARGQALTDAERATLESGVLFTLMELCREFRLPVQIMCGAVRGAYGHGVPQGTDLPEAGDTLRNLLPLFNSFEEVTFCVSALSDSQAQELASYGWIVHNVVVSGHWWYDTIPAYIARDLAARLQSVPKNKLIGYFSDMYKLEFGLPKFNMYRRVLARVLAQDYVADGRGNEEDALDVARLLLRENAKRIFGV
jgi:glucuronate isomerase